MIPKIFFLTGKRYIGIKYTTKEEFYEIKKIIEGFGFKRDVFSGTRYLKGGAFDLKIYKSFTGNPFILKYSCCGSRLAHFANYTVEDLLNLF